MTASRSLLVAIALAGAGFPVRAIHAQSGRPLTGTDVLEQMRKKYDGKWYQTLTFWQRTTFAGRNGGAPTEQTWYESLEFTSPAGGWLRIDQGNPADGNGSLSTADSTWVVRAAKLTRTDGSGNPFVPLIENVYLQPVATTAQQLAPLHIDLTRATTGTWDGRPVYVVGVSAITDSTTPQFWVDRERLVLVRMILNLRANGPPYDIQLGKLVETGGGWLATKVVMFSGGVARQTEEYFDWKTNVKLDPRLFDVTTWSSAMHWAKP